MIFLKQPDREFEPVSHALQGGAAEKQRLRSTRHGSNSQLSGASAGRGEIRHPGNSTWKAHLLRGPSFVEPAQHFAYEAQGRDFAWQGTDLDGAPLAVLPDFVLDHRVRSARHRVDQQPYAPVGGRWTQSDNCLDRGAIDVAHHGSAAWDHKLAGLHVLMSVSEAGEQRHRRC